MADQREITLYPGDATPKDIVLRSLPVATVSAGTTIYLYQGDATPNDPILRDPTTASVTGPQSYELVAGAGDYALTVGSAGLFADRQLSASVGAFSISVGDAALAVGRVLSCGTAAFAFIVGDAELTYTASEGGWIFKRERTRRPEPEEEEAPPRPKKSRRGTLRLIKRAAQQAVAENRLLDVAPLVWAFERERVDYSEHLEQIYWRLVKAEIERRKREDDEEAILLML